MSGVGRHELARLAGVAPDMFDHRPDAGKLLLWAQERDQFGLYGLAVDVLVEVEQPHLQARVDLPGGRIDPDVGYAAQFAAVGEASLGGVDPEFRRDVVAEQHVGGGEAGLPAEPPAFLHYPLSPQAPAKFA